jgi:hypothetical protein
MTATANCGLTAIHVPLQDDEVPPAITGADHAQEGQSLPSTDNEARHLPEFGGQAASAGETDESYAGCRARERSAEYLKDPWLHRDRTVALLKQYARMAVESGRLPSLLGRECFGTRVTPYAMASFEDMAIFVHDMQTALSQLDELQQQLITLNVLEEFAQWEIARELQCTTRWIEWQVSDALDDLSGELVKRGLLSCQERRENENGGKSLNKRGK